MNKIRRHRPGWDYEGYGVYDFDNPMRGYGQLPPGVSIDDIVANMDAHIVNVGGIQVAATNVQQPLMDVLDKMDFTPDGDETLPTVSGQATYMVFSFGSGFATEFREAGYAIMGEKVSVQTGNPRMLLTQIPQVIADNAFMGGPYVVVSAPDSLLAAASQALTAKPPPPKPNGNGAPVVTVPPGCYLDMEEKLVCPPAQAEPKLAAWVVPTVIGATALALIAVAAVAGGKR